MLTLFPSKYSLRPIRLIILIPILPFSTSSEGSRIFTTKIYTHRLPSYRSMQPALQEQKVIMQIDFLSGTYAMSSIASLMERRLPKILLTQPAASLEVGHIILKKQLPQDSQLRPLPPVTSDPEGPTPIISDHPLKPAQNRPPFTIFDSIPVLRLIRWIIRKLLRRARPDEKRRRKGRRDEVGVESHIPLEISLILSK